MTHHNATQQCAVMHNQRIMMHNRSTICIVVGWSCGGIWCACLWIAALCLSTCSFANYKGLSLGVELGFCVPCCVACVLHCPLVELQWHLLHQCLLVGLQPSQSPHVFLLCTLLNCMLMRGPVQSDRTALFAVQFCCISQEWFRPQGASGVPVGRCWTPWLLLDFVGRHMAAVGQC